MRRRKHAHIVTCRKYKTVSERYDSTLAGITWLRISHKYSVSEVDALVPTGTTPVVLAAVRSIYTGLTGPQLVLALPGPPPCAVTVTMQPSSNASSNIASGYTFLGEGLTRVHPAAYAALFDAAIASGVNRITVSSGWRPMLGSIGHRAGLGLDGNYVGPIQVNRERLTVGTAASLNVSAAEKSAFRAWNSNKTAVNKAAWNSILEQEQPAVVNAFRNALDGSPRVKQIMDPWLMDVDSLDATAGTPNPHFTENEQLHWDHLHITIHEPKILGD